MWFKNLTVFQLIEPFTLTSDELEEKLQALAFRHCGPHEEFSVGWTQPIDTPSQLLSYSANGYIMLCAKKEERVLPSAVLHELVQEKTAETEEKLGRKLSKKERGALKDEVLFDVLPKAFTFSRKLYAYIDIQGSWIIVNSASTKSAEDLVSLLRKSLGSLATVPINVLNRPATVMTKWLSDQTPDNLSIEDECELQVPEENGAIVRCKRHDLTVPEILNHIENGKEVIKLAINWGDRLSLVLDQQLLVKRLKFLELIDEEASQTAVHDEISRFDADFSIMTAEIKQFLPVLFDWFGGLAKSV